MSLRVLQSHLNSKLNPSSLRRQKQKKLHTQRNSNRILKKVYNRSNINVVVQNKKPNTYIKTYVYKCSKMQTDTHYEKANSFLTTQYPATYTCTLTVSLQHLNQGRESLSTANFILHHDA